MNALEATDKRTRSRLYALRVGLGWSGEELASRAGVSARTVYNAELGERKPNRATRQVLATALGCEPDDLLLDDAMSESRR